ncbi:hypothetical protein ACEE90_02785 [Corynebacterium phoceense]
MTHDVPDYAIVGGIPAKQIRYRFPIDLVTDLSRTEWWLYPPSVLKELHIENPRTFCDEVNRGALLGIPKYEPTPILARDLDKLSSLN